MNEYHQQAIDFLKETNTTVVIELCKGQTCPEWGDCKSFFYNVQGRHGVMCPHNHGMKYLVTITRPGHKSVSFDFWNSINDTYGATAKKIIKAKLDNNYSLEDINNPKIKDMVKPREYDILACISGDAYAMELTFEEFCSDYGYDTDSIKAKSTYDATCDLSRKINRIWNTKEIEKLQEIQ